jgi:branched-chain amino acid transport system permease protein
MFDSVVQFVASSLTEGSIYGLMALGLVIVLRSTEVLFFAQGAIAMVGGVVLYQFFGQMHLPLIVSIPVSLTICVVVSLLSLKVIVLPLLARGASAMNVSIVTIGIGMLLETAAMLVFGTDSLAVPSFSGDEPVTILGANFAPQHFWVLGFAAIALLLALVFFKGTPMGKATTGLGDNEFLSRVLGFPTGRLFMVSFVFAALVGGIGGIVYAPISYTGYWIGTRLTIKGFLAASVGGITNPLGAIVGGLLVGAFESFTAGFISSRVKDCLAFVLLLFVLRLRPQGLFGKRQ